MGQTLWLPFACKCGCCVHVQDYQPPSI
jgi:hypothetical protein